MTEKVNPHLTSPNPRVGCVIVLNGKIISIGVHEKYGRFHAEKNAILKLEEKDFSNWAGSEIFVTLEPCDKFKGKKTESCTDLIIKKKFKKIYVLQEDLHFKGENIAKLRKLGFNVIVGCSKALNEKLNNLNPFFETYILKKKPYVTLKIAESLNGKINFKKDLNKKNEEYNILNNDFKKLKTREILKSDRFTSIKSLQEVHKMRAKYGYLLTSAKTVLVDNPSFNVRLEKNEVSFKFSNPHLIILGKTKIPRNFNIFKYKDRKIYFFDDLENFINSDLYFKIDSIMTECGGLLNTSLLKSGIVDELNFFIAPKIFEENQPNSFYKKQNLANFYLKSVDKFEDDIYLRFLKS